MPFDGFSVTVPDMMNLVGQRFGRLLVLEPAPQVGVRKYWCVVCDCGKGAVVQQGKLRSGRTQSCGCIRKEMAARLKLSHGWAGTPTYRVWKGMISRSGKVTKRADYSHVTVCDRWQKFENFLADMGKRPDDTTIDRIDNSKGYEPDNTRWASPSEQMSNRRRWKNKTYRGKPLKGYNHAV